MRTVPPAFATDGLGERRRAAAFGAAEAAFPSAPCYFFIVAGRPARPAWPIFRTSVCTAWCTTAVRPGPTSRGRSSRWAKSVDDQALLLPTEPARLWRCTVRLVRTRGAAPLALDPDRSALENVGEMLPAFLLSVTEGRPRRDRERQEGQAGQTIALDPWSRADRVYTTREGGPGNVIKAQPGSSVPPSTPREGGGPPGTECRAQDPRPRRRADGGQPHNHC